MDDCLFCKIANGTVPSEKVYEDEDVIVFKDINPAAPIHMLAVPKEHIASALELNEDNADVVSHIFLVAAQLAKMLGFAEDGFRIVNNCGKDGGQTVGHLHFHILAGRNMAGLRVDFADLKKGKAPCQICTAN